MNEGVKIELKGANLKRILAQLAASSADLTRPMRDVGEYLLRETMERFQNEKDPDGNKWKPLAPATIAAKGNANILSQSGRLLRSILYRPYRTGVEIGTNLEYAAIHQFGGTIKREAHDVTLRFRTNAKGDLLSQARDTRGRHLPFDAPPTGPRMADRRRQLVVFAKDSHKNAVEMKAKVGAHEFDMPSRPFLGINDTDRGEVAGILAEWFERKFRQGAR